MSALNWAGVAIVSLVMLAIFGMVWKVEGFKDAAIGFGLSVVVTAAIVFGAHLMAMPS